MFHFLSAALRVVLIKKTAFTFILQTVQVKNLSKTSRLATYSARGRSVASVKARALNAEQTKQTL